MSAAPRALPESEGAPARRAPLRDAVLRTLSRGMTTFGLPAHGPGHHVDPDTEAALGRQVFRADAFSPKGIDDRRESEGVVEAAEAEAARAWGASACRFLTGGSTQGVQSALLACCRPGDTVLIGANEHKSAWCQVVAMGLVPVPILPAVDDAIGAEHGVTRAGLEAALEAHPRAAAVLVTGPTYFGTLPDVAGLAAVAHEAGLPLIADEAWGAHLAFSDALPRHALACGADISVGSLHKSMGALSQGAVFCRQGDLVDPDRFDFAWDYLQSSSISTPIMASIDGTRAAYEADGEALVAGVLSKADRVRAAAAAAGYGVLDQGVLDGDGAFALDRAKVTLSVAPMGANGFEVEDWITAHHDLYLGMSDAERLQMTIGPGTTDAEIDRLCTALSEAAGAGGWTGVPTGAPGYDELPVEVACPPARAFFGPTEMVPLAQVEGRIAAEIVVPYPPGVPRLFPGQRVGAAQVAFLEAQRAMGALIKGCAAEGASEVRVVR